VSRSGPTCDPVFATRGQTSALLAPFHALSARNPAGLRAAPARHITGQVGCYHPIKMLDPDFVLPVLR
jgi:hypothetical protein